MGKLVSIAELFVLASLPAFAQERGSKDVSVEYSYVRANPATTGFPDFNANGGSASFAFSPRNWYGIAGEFSGYHIGRVGRVNVGTDLFTFMFGPQLYFHHYRRFSPFAHELLGGRRTINEYVMNGSIYSFPYELG